MVSSDIFDAFIPCAKQFLCVTLSYFPTTLYGSTVIPVLKKKRLSFRVVKELEHPAHTICMIRAIDRVLYWQFSSLKAVGLSSLFSGAIG